VKFKPKLIECKSVIYI